MSKPALEKAVTKSFSMPLKYLAGAEERQKMVYHLPRFSDYVQMLIAKDLYSEEPAPKIKSN